jgi:curved DNA-binding protein CbpA
VSEASPIGTSAIARIRDNPFYVLGLRPDATRQAIERQGTKLLGMLELELKSAAAYATPVGRAERTTEKVRSAMAELRDPSRRLEHEIWARLDPGALPAATRDVTPVDEDPAPRAPRAADPWPEALAAFGWRGV